MGLDVSKGPGTCTRFLLPLTHSILISLPFLVLTSVQYMLATKTSVNY